MFDQTFVDGVGKTNKSWTVTVSFLVQMGIIAVLVILPLIFTDVLPKATLVSMLQAPAPPPPPPPPPPPKNDKPVTVGGKVFEGRIVKRVPPDYPRVAKLARVQGAVRYTAVIGKDGKIRDLKYVSGPAMLATPDVMRAVSEWEYQPYLMNSEPVDVITEITVNFVLN